MHNEEGKKLRNVYIIIAYTFIVWSIQHTVHDKKPFLDYLQKHSQHYIQCITLHQSCIRYSKKVKLKSSIFKKSHAIGEKTGKGSEEKQNKRKTNTGQWNIVQWVHNMVFLATSLI